MATWHIWDVVARHLHWHSAVRLLAAVSRDAYDGVHGACHGPRGGRPVRATPDGIAWRRSILPMALVPPDFDGWCRVPLGDWAGQTQHAAVRAIRTVARATGKTLAVGPDEDWWLFLRDVLPRTVGIPRMRFWQQRCPDEVLTFPGLKCVELDAFDAHGPVATELAAGGVIIVARKPQYKEHDLLVDWTAKSRGRAEPPREGGCQQQ
jgi:hypothetical protein